MFSVVNLESGNGKFFAYVFFKIAHKSFFDLRRGNKHVVCAEFRGKTLFDVFVDDNLKTLAVANGFNNLIRFFNLVNCFFGKQNATGIGVAFADSDLKLRPFGIIGRLVRAVDINVFLRNKTVFLAADAKLDALVVRGNNSALYAFSFLVADKRFFYRVKKLCVLNVCELFTHVPSYLRNQLLRS